jgi:hypothetical protein
MRAWIAVLVGVNAVTFAVPAGAQPSTPGGGATSDVPAVPLLPPPPTDVAPAAVIAPQGGTSTSGQTNPLSGVGIPPLSASGSLTGTPNPQALAPSTGDELTFSAHGFLRAPMRMGMSSRPTCPAGTPGGTLVLPTGKTIPATANEPQTPAPPGAAAGGGATAQTTAPTAPFAEVQCAGPGQSHTDLHTPRLPDDQYLDPRFTRQWEKDWTEVFFNYGNSHMVGTVAFQAFGLTDAEHTSVDNISSQLGIAQAWVTLMPNIGKLRLNWKVGAFWDKYGMSGKYDAGKYDMYLFGRLHVMGQTLRAEYPVGDFTLRASEGFGVKNEELEFTPITYGFPGYTLVGHVHGGISYKKVLDVNFHYITAWAQDARIQGPATAQGEAVTEINAPNGSYNSGILPDGHIDVAGGEARFTGGVFGELYAGYSHLSAVQAEQVGPAIEPLASLGGYSGGTANAVAPTSYPNPVPASNYYGPNGIMDNYLGSCFKCTPLQVGTGSIDSVLVQYDFSFGTLYRKIKTHSGFYGDGPEVWLSLFGLYQSVKSTDTSGWFPLVGDGVKKVKYGADLIVTPISWFAFGVRGDVVQPTSMDSHESFGVISPKIMFRSKYLSHEEITMQYSHYFFGSDVLPQPPNGPAASFANGTSQWPVYAPDPNVFGIKATMWW